jgi:hypothetical protein
VRVSVNLCPKSCLTFKEFGCSRSSRGPEFTFTEGSPLTLSIGLERSLYVQEKQKRKEEMEPNRQVPAEASFDRLRQPLVVDR